MHYPLRIARPQCNRNLSIKMDSFCLLCTYCNPEGRGGEGLGEEYEGKDSISGECFHRMSSWVRVKTTQLFTKTQTQSVCTHQWDTNQCLLWGFAHIHSDAQCWLQKLEMTPIGIVMATSDPHPQSTTTLFSMDILWAPRGQPINSNEGFSPTAYSDIFRLLHCWLSQRKSSLAHCLHTWMKHK